METGFTFLLLLLAGLILYETRIIRIGSGNPKRILLQ